MKTMIEDIKEIQKIRELKHQSEKNIREFITKEMRTFQSKTGMLFNSISVDVSKMLREDVTILSYIESVKISVEL